MRVRSYMRWAIMVVATLGTACHEQFLGPASPVRVTLSLHPLPPGLGALSAPTIVVEGDSVVARDAIQVSGCYDYAASGQAPIGQLVLKVVQTETNRFCIPEPVLSEAIVVAYGLPAGLRYALLDERTVHLDGSSFDTQAARDTIVVP